MAGAEASNGGVNSFNIESLFSSERDFLIRNNGDQVKINSFKGKKLALYFSASWCGPCHRFTPILTEVYNKISPKGDFEVVFISGDQDDASFDGYFSKMPWLAIPFSDSETRSRLDEVFEVTGIPHLVLLDENGKVVSNDGVEIMGEYGAEAYPFTEEKIKELKEEEERAKREQSLKSILVSDCRDFVVASDGKQIPVSELEGKIVGLYFSAASFKPCADFTAQLLEVYQKLKENGESSSFEIVLISLDREEESFKKDFENMPWLALPFQDKSCQKLTRYFELSRLPTVVVIGSDGKTVNSNAAEAIKAYGIEAFPFTSEKIKELKEEEERAKREQTLKSVLVTDCRDFVVASNGKQIPVSELEGKTVGLYFSDASFKPCADFTAKLLEVYQKLKENGESSSFEIVLISLEREEESFKKNFENMPWLALPFQDKGCQKLTRYFEVSRRPTLVIIGPDGKTVNSNAAEAIEDYGVEAFPFTSEKVAEIEKARENSQTLESVLVSGDRDFVIGKDGNQIPVSGLVGKTILLYFSASWCPPCRAFLPKFIEAYEKIKEKDEEFEVIFVSSDRDQTSFDQLYSEMPWLALPFGDPRKASLGRKFKVHGIPKLVAIGKNGRTVTKEARNMIAEHGADAYPFTEERLKEIEQSQEGWTCEGEVCRKA